MISLVKMHDSIYYIVLIILNFHVTLAFDPKSICSDVGAELWKYVPCDEYYKPDNCFDSKKHNIDLDEFDRCGPAYVPNPLQGRNYYLDVSGRGESFYNNLDALRKIKIVPKALRDVTKNSTKVTILGMEVDYPIGMSPVSLQKFANREGELGTATGLSNWKSIMVLSSYSTSLLEDVAKKVEGSQLHLWMQLYIFANRNDTLQIARRAQRSGYKALVITADSNVFPAGTCNAKVNLTLPAGSKLNVHNETNSHNATFADVAYFQKHFDIPIVVKGILSVSDAIRAIEAGASAIWVSNHGGRQLDYAPASIDALPSIADAVKKQYPEVEVYVDSGFRSGYDVYKGLARGAKMVFMGRPFIWGLAYNGSSGVNQVMDIITKEFQEVMTLSGHTHPSEISIETLLPQYPTF